MNTREEMVKKITSMLMPLVIGAFFIGNILGIIQGYLIGKGSL